MHASSQAIEQAIEPEGEPLVPRFPRHRIDSRIHEQVLRRAGARAARDNVGWV